VQRGLADDGPPDGLDRVAGEPLAGELGYDVAHLVMLGAGLHACLCQGVHVGMRVARLDRVPVPVRWLLEQRMLWLCPGLPA
jgi:hypothetical protein